MPVLLNNTKTKNYDTFARYEKNHPIGPEFWHCLDRGKFSTLKLDIPRGIVFNIYIFKETLTNKQKTTTRTDKAHKTLRIPMKVKEAF